MWNEPYEMWKEPLVIRSSAFTSLRANGDSAAVSHLQKSAVIVLKES